MISILVVEDDPVSLHLTKTVLESWGYSFQFAESGEQAWNMLEQDGVPDMLILDWKMPGLSGIELAEKIRASERLKSIYIIMLSASSGRENMLEGLKAGADDYLEKPLDPMVMKARIQVGERIIRLQKELLQKVAEIKEALDNVRELRGLLPICSYCKKIRNDENYWERLETYLGHHTHAQFSHSICPSCYDSVVKEELQAYKKQQSEE